MPLFAKYKHLDGYIEAVSFTDANTPEILKELLVHLNKDELLLFKADTRKDKTISWQYKTDDSPYELTLGSYLIRSNTGKYTVMSKEEFEDKYFESTKPSLSKYTSIKGAIAKLVNMNEVEVTVDRITTILEDQIKHWRNAFLINVEYDQSEDTITVYLVNQNIISFKGFAILVEGILNTSYFKNTTYLVVDLSTTTEDSRNVFDPVALRELQGELKEIGPRIGKRLRKIILTNSISDNVTVNMKAGAQAIATKVTSTRIIF